MYDDARPRDSLESDGENGGGGGGGGEGGGGGGALSNERASIVENRGRGRCSRGVSVAITEVCVCVCVRNREERSAKRRRARKKRERENNRRKLVRSFVSSPRCRERRDNGSRLTNGGDNEKNWIFPYLLFSSTSDLFLGRVIDHIRER